MRYAGAGARVTLVCATNGSGGPDPQRLGCEKVARVRQEELREACHVLGVNRLEFLEDRDEPHGNLNRTNYVGVIGSHCRWVQTRGATARNRRKHGHVIFSATREKVDGY